MSTRLLLQSFLIAFLMGGCASPLLIIEEPTEQERATARQILHNTTLTDAALADTMDELSEQIGLLNAKVVTAAQRVCQLYKSSRYPLRCNAVWNAVPTIYTDDTVVNAFADEKDNVGLYTGLLFNMRLESERAAVLAHEYAHVMLGHSRKKGDNAFAGAMLGGVLTAVLAGKHLNRQSMETGQRLGVLLGSRAYSPEMEMAADRMAVYILRQAGYPVVAMRNSMIRLHRLKASPGTARGSISRVGFLETHPSDDRRIAHILSAIHDNVTGIPLTAK